MALHDGELRTAAKRAGVEVVQHVSKLWWLYVGQMRVERTAELSIGGCWTHDAERGQK